MDAELADQRIEGDHLRRIIRRHMNGLARDEDIELIGIEDDLGLAARRDRLPIVEHVAGRALVDIDDAGMALGAIADDAARAFEIDREQ